MDYNKKNSLHLILLKIFESIRIFFNNILEMPFIFLFYRPSKNYTKGKLLLINTGDLGDNILTFNFLKTLTNSNLFNEIHLVVKNPIESIYNFPNPFYNIIEWKKNKYKFNLFYKIKFINQLQSEKYETVFNITPERGIFNEELTLTSGARNYWKINKSNPYLNSILKSFYDKRYQKNFKINSNNEYELLDEIISQLNLNMNKSPKIENVLYKKKIDEKFIVISPFSSIPAKSWELIIIYCWQKN